MTNDYSEMVEPIGPETSNTRLQPLLALTVAQIPNFLWGYDAMLCNNVDYEVAMQELQIIVRRTDLEAAKAAIIEDDFAYLSFNKATFLAEFRNSRYFFEAECEFLWGPCYSGQYEARWIVLIPDDLRYVSVMDEASSELLVLSPYFRLNKQRFKDVKVTTFFTLLNSMIKQLRLWDTEGPNFNPDPKDSDFLLTGVSTLEVEIVTVIAWKAGMDFGRYKSMEDIPSVFVEMYKGLDPENRVWFRKRVFGLGMKQRDVDVFLQARSAEATEATDQSDSKRMRDNIKSDNTGLDDDKVSRLRRDKITESKTEAGADILDREIERETQMDDPEPVFKRATNQSGTEDWNSEERRSLKASLYERGRLSFGLKPPKQNPMGTIDGEKEASKEGRKTLKGVQRWIAKRLKAV